MTYLLLDPIRNCADDIGLGPSIEANRGTKCKRIFLNQHLGFWFRCWKKVRAIYMITQFKQEGCYQG